MTARITALRGTLLLDEPMAEHTSWRIGGPADRFYKPADVDDLQAFLAQLPAAEPLYWLGLGSNLLVRDGGIRGTVICTTGVLDTLTVDASGQVYAGAGVTCAKVARFCARQGLQAAEFLAGIPGTMGGALAMNAGAFGGETWELVARAETMDRHGVRRVRAREEFTVAYRQVKMPAGEWFIGAWLRLDARSGSEAAGKDRIKQLLEQRNRTQPTSQPSAGSTFRNPPGDYAARLIEACGLKGRCVGKACISEKHANFIINTGGALASEVEQLMALAAQEVKNKFGVELIREVHIVGENGR